MTLDTAISQMTQLQNDLPDIMQKMAFGAASNAKEVIQTRVQTTGRTATYPNVFQMSPYSKGYKEWKIKQKRVLKSNPGLAFVDLTLTGDMWRGIGVIKIEGVTATLGSQNPDTTNKLLDLEHTKGFSLDISDLELEHIEDDLVDDFEIEVKKRVRFK